MKEVNSISLDQEVIRRILERGNTAEIKRDRDGGVVILEVRRKLAGTAAEALAGG